VWVGLREVEAQHAQRVCLPLVPVLVLVLEQELVLARVQVRVRVRVQVRVQVRVRVRVRVPVLVPFQKRPFRLTLSPRRGNRGSDPACAALQVDLSPSWPVLHGGNWYIPREPGRSTGLRPG